MNFTKKRRSWLMVLPHRGDAPLGLSLIHISEPTRLGMISYAVFCLKKYLPKGASPLCGNTISQDRRFLVKFMPKLEAFFHYRNLDVSTLKELSRRWKPEVYSSFKKQQKHTALADVHESIDELAHYREHFIKL